MTKNSNGTKRKLQQGSKSDTVKIDRAELGQTFIDNSGGRFPPVLNIDQAAELLQVSKSTIYEWSSKGNLKGCSRKRGKRLFFWRDALIKEVFNGKEWKS